MYSSIRQVNLLTSLLIAHGVRHAVLCPGSRNAPICHDIKTCGAIECHAVTDERSAGFYAIGVSQANGMSPVAVCVTSGSAILDVAPAAAEAHYQGVPLIVISADRPSAWIGQQDGQTMPQTESLGRMARKAVSLPEGVTEEDLWHANRLVNEALTAATAGGRGPVVINVPLHEPLYEFDVAALPEERKMEIREPSLSEGDEWLAQRIGAARRPMMIIGQTCERAAQEGMDKIRAVMPIVSEAISAVGGQMINEAVHIISHSAMARKEDYEPDLVIYAGGTLVSKDVKNFIRKAAHCETVVISPDGEPHDVFQNTTTVVRATLSDVLINLVAQLSAIECEESHTAERRDFAQRWHELLAATSKICRKRSGTHSQLRTMQTFAGEIGQVGNSSAVRLLCMSQTRHAFCNRGINGIDGSLSTAAGYAASLPTSRHCLCAIGDLSFFYDQNALWNKHVDGRLRILLLNNGGGGIFSKFAGLRQSPARDEIVMARHTTTAAGICEQNGVERRTARSAEEVERLRGWLTEELPDNSKAAARLLEVFTDIDEDARATKDYYEYIVTEYDKGMAKD